MGKFAGFQKVKLDRPQKSTFDLSHDKRLSMSMGYLTPVLITECVPSDYFSGSTEMLVRLAPLLAPIYDQINVYVHFFFVPNRLLWEDWEEFITGGRLGVGVDPITAPIPPAVEIFGAATANPNIFNKSQLANYLGCPLWPLGDNIEDYNGKYVDLMPFAAYQLIWQEYYRDRNFIADDDPDFMAVIPMPSGLVANNDNMMELRLRAYSHDYFTSALPFTQRGEEVLIPLDGSVTYLQQSIVKRSDTGDPMSNEDLLLGTQSPTTDFPPGTLATYNNYGTGTGPGGGVTAARIENIDSISNISTTINDFRSAYALQVWLERNAVGGSRYTESTQAHFGVRPQDSRLQRPEYIGGGRIPVRISEVVSTAYSQNSSDATVPLANMAGHGITYGNTNHFKYFCTEHGFILGLCSIMNPPSYHQGLSKMFRRRSFLDYPWPTFAKLGEQQVDKAEIYANHINLDEDDDGILPLFGYQSRYADWKYIPNSNHGDFHDTLLFWTLTRDFADSPELGWGFNMFDLSIPPRIFAAGITGDHAFWLYISNRVSVKRPLPYFGTPNTLGFV